MKTMRELSNEQLNKKIEWVLEHLMKAPYRASLRSYLQSLVIEEELRFHRGLI